MSSHSNMSDRSPTSSTSTPSNSVSGLDVGSTPISTPGTQPIPKKSQQIKTDKPRPHVCLVCTRAFARLEHLKRHERSHTNEKPFQCAACGRCFARRDLVLRHQQKLHSKIPNVMRRGSKDTDTNEFIIVLNNNTDAVAPLPLGFSPSYHVDSVSPSKFDEKNSGLYSPPKSDANSKKPKFRTGLFTKSSAPSSTKGTARNSMQSISLPNNSMIPSPIPTNSNHNTPPGMLPCSNLSSGISYLQHLNQQPSPQSHHSPKRSAGSVSAIPVHLQNQISPPESGGLNGLLNYRHMSFSAMSGISYTNLKDAMDIQQQSVNLSELAPGEIGFSTPQLNATNGNSKNFNFSNLDLNSLGMMDWNNIDSLDLNHGSHNNIDNKENDLNARQKSLKNLQQYFYDNMPTLPSNTDIQNNPPTIKGKSKETNIAPHEFQNPDHPHHIKGTTPFEFGMPTLSEVNLMQFAPECENYPSPSFTLNSQSVEANKRRSQESGSVKSNHENPGVKRSKIDSIQENQSSTSSPLSNMAPKNDDEWLKEIISTPYELNVPAASHHIGFVDPQAAFGENRDEVPNNNINPTGNHKASPDEISSLFLTRQIDLVKQMDGEFPKPEFKDVDVHDINVEFAFDTSILKTGHYNFISEDLRNKIIMVSNISETQFPPVEDLNNYMSLYEQEFNKYFPFIHLPSLKNPMVDNFENIPLLLSMASIGALYSYHDTNTLLLFNLSKFHIQNFFEKEITLDNLQFKKVPLMAHQCLVLHIFISMFLNEPNMIDVTSRQIKSMIGLIKSTNFNVPLEQFLVPPPLILEVARSGQDKAKTQHIVQNNFDYFIMAQSRIRTIHVFYLLQTFRATLVGFPIYLDNTFLKSGNHCFLEDLWKSENSQTWLTKLSSSVKSWSLIDVSNGESFESMVNLMLDNSNSVGNDNKWSLNNLLALIMYLHERVQLDLSAMKYFNYFNWNLKNKPKYERLIKLWEVRFLQNNGVLKIDDHNRYLLTLHNELKLILPMYSLLKIKLNVNLNAFLAPLLTKDWVKMNNELNKLNAIEDRYEIGKTCLPFTLDIIQLWTYNIETIRREKRPYLRSPVMFVICIGVAILIFSNYINYLECKIVADIDDLSEVELMNWIKCETIILEVEKVSSPILKSSYSEILSKQANGVLRSFKEDNVLLKVKNLVEQREKIISETDFNQEFSQKDRVLESITRQINQEIKNDKLSVKSLYLGIRILADAPVWPIAMGFAESLKHRATSLNSSLAKAKERALSKVSQ